MEYHVSHMVLDDDERVSCCIIKQAVSIGDSVGGRFLLLRGDLV